MYHEKVVAVAVVVVEDMAIEVGGDGGGDDFEAATTLMMHHSIQLTHFEVVGTAEYCALLPISFVPELRDGSAPFFVYLLPSTLAQPAGDPRDLDNYWNA